MSRDRALVGHLPLDPLGHQLQLVLDVLLEIAVGRAARHRPDRAHAAIGFVGAALVEERLARRFLGPGEQRADHHRRRARGQRLGDVARGADAAVGDHRDARFRAAAFDAAMIARQLRHADAGDDPRGADRARADADLDRVGAGIGQRLAPPRRWRRCRRRPGRCSTGSSPARPPRATSRLWPCAVSMTMQSHAGVDQRLAALEARVADRGRGGDAQPALARPWSRAAMATAFSMSLTVISPTQ